VHVFLLVFWDALLTTLGSLTATLVENWRVWVVPQIGTESRP
jgi:hypothetical protein